MEEYESNENCDRKRPRRATEFDEINELTHKWFLEATARKVNVSGPLLQEKALRFASDLKIDNFKASNGWLASFLKRHNIVFKTMSGERGTVNMDTVAEWNERIPTVCEGYEPCDIFNMDETGLYYRDTTKSTYFTKGETCSGGKRSKERITVALCASMTGIPMLVMVDENSSIITLDGRLAMNEDREGQEFPWYPKPINELTEGAAIQLNESACLVLFVEPDDDEVDRARDILLSSAQEEHDKGEHQDLYFFIGADDDICDPVREFAGLSDKTPLLAILDFPEQKVYISDVTDITSDIVKTFVKGYLEETLQSRPCRR